MKQTILILNKAQTYVFRERVIAKNNLLEEPSIPKAVYLET